MNSDTHGKNISAYQAILNQTSFSCHGACINTTDVLQLCRVFASGCWLWHRSH